MRGKVLKILKPAADLDGNQDLNLSGGSKAKTRIKIKIMKLRTGTNGKEVNGERTSVDCQYHAARERAQGRREKVEGREIRNPPAKRDEIRTGEGLGLRSRLRLRATGFTLIEMIGVLAVIAILGALLIPKVFDAINNSRINNAAVSIRTVKAAVADHFGAYGDLNSLGGTNLLSVPLTNYDGTVLMSEGFLDKPFAVKIGASATVQIVQVGGGTGTANGGYDYNLDGVSGGSTTNSQLVVEAVIYGVAALDAKDLNDRIDGPALGSTSVNTIDSKGRVEYEIGRA